MELFQPRVTVTMPLDRACITAAWVDIVLAVVNCAFGFHVVDSMLELAKPKDEFPNGINPEEISYHEFGLHRKAHPENHFTTIAVMTYGLICYIIFILGVEIWLCRLLYGAAKHGDVVALKKWWWWRLSLFLIDFVISISRVLDAEHDILDFSLILFYTWRTSELIVTFLFKRQLA
ncbi:hypothetical protein Ocin01_09024 [Orchesella cincta]|uniref:Uncharacterized protein n=1 Tax=Orchesella cincta TaxID=48709 RepID=A0A1D2MYC1_ORCCI|nr:hypothetical protein Ocin01_09024 [Orchesella cincta]